MTDKEKRAHNHRIAMARASKQERMVKEPEPGTWSAKKPPYAGTSLCPDQEDRKQNLTKIHRICLRCRRSYSGDTENMVCECGGRLYATGECYQPKVRGGGSGEERNESGASAGNLPEIYR